MTGPELSATLPGNLLLAGVIGVLYAVGAYLILQRTLTRVLIGIGLLSHGANLLLIASGGPAGRAPLVTLTPGDGAGRAIGDTADPLPQAMALTAIVITFALTAFLLALAYRSFLLTRDDEVPDDVEDRRIARKARSDEPGEQERALLAELDADPAYDESPGPRQPAAAGATGPADRPDRPDLRGRGGRSGA